MATDATARFRDLLADFTTAMLVTITADGKLRSRPMVIAQRLESGDLRFITNDATAKVDELLENAQVNVALQSANKFLSISGTTSVSYDKPLIDRIWQPSWSFWFPQGKDDPNVRLITVRAEIGEYWDMSGMNTLKFLFESGRAVLRGEAPHDQDPALHAKVDLAS